MGILKALFSHESEDHGDLMLEGFVRGYRDIVKSAPFSPPVDHLRQAWLNHFSKFPNKFAKQILPEVVEAIATTHACLNPPDCGVAPGLLALFEEVPAITTKYPKYAALYGELMGKIQNLYREEKFDDLNELFRRVNSQSMVKDPFPIGGSDHYNLMKSIGRA
jgi:hypothetical protein